MQHLTVALHCDAGHFSHQTYFYVLSALYAFPLNVFSCVSGVCDVWSRVRDCLPNRFSFFFALFCLIFVLHFHHLAAEMNLTLDGRHLSDAFLCSGLLCLYLEYTQTVTNSTVFRIYKM